MRSSMILFFALILLTLGNFTLAQNIREVGHFDTPSSCSDVVISGHIAFVSDEAAGLFTQVSQLNFFVSTQH